MLLNTIIVDFILYFKIAFAILLYIVCNANPLFGLNATSLAEFKNAFAKVIITLCTLFVA